MRMRTELKRCVRVQVYVPRHSLVAALERGLTEHFNGWTGHPNAVGTWAAPTGKVIVEPVRVYESLSLRHFTQTAQIVMQLGEEFLAANPNEQCFMAYVGGRVLTIER